MNWHDAALGMAGVIGCGVSAVHGVLTQRLMVGPFEQLADRRIAAPIRRLVPLLLQFSTFNWFVGGLALIVAANSFEQEARLATGLLVGSSYAIFCVARAGLSKLYTVFPSAITQSELFMDRVAREAITRHPNSCSYSVATGR
jgi:hypothetical protein